MTEHNTEYHDATPDDLAQANSAASHAFLTYGRSSNTERAQLLRRIADEIEALGDTLLETFTAESALPRARAESERTRTCFQLRLFATTLEEGNWAEPHIDRADPISEMGKKGGAARALPGLSPAPTAAKAIPKPDIRSLLRPLGPVVVFGPANFPLAYGVAGGDVASALAAGCPVIAKAHPSHPGVCMLVGGAVAKAVKASGWPSGVYGLVHGGQEVGAALVGLPAVRAVGFTGSRSAGQDLLARCQRRPVPIPFFGELSGVNPICLLPGALAARATAIAEGLHVSVTNGVGQFCTKPGLVLYVDGGAGVQEFRDKLSTLIRGTPPAPMLSGGIRHNYGEGLARLGRAKGVTTLVAAADVSGQGANYGSAALFACDSATLRAQHALQEEVFGPTTLLVACRDVADMVATIDTLDGQLTATVHEAGDDLASAGDLLWVFEQHAGRLIFNGYPTGVEVCASMVHGGPWPATTDSRFTAVGPAAIRRFVRPVCYQNAPAACLPEVLRDSPA